MALHMIEISEYGAAYDRSFTVDKYTMDHKGMIRAVCREKLHQIVRSNLISARKEVF